MSKTRVVFVIHFMKLAQDETKCKVEDRDRKGAND
jgi:hypothetical protein